MGISMVQLEHIRNLKAAFPTSPPTFSWTSAADKHAMAWEQQGLYMTPPPLLTCVFLASVATGSSFSFRPVAC